VQLVGLARRAAGRRSRTRSRSRSAAAVRTAEMIERLGLQESGYEGRPGQRRHRRRLVRSAACRRRACGRAVPHYVAARQTQRRHCPDPGSRASSAWQSTRSELESGPPTRAPGRDRSPERPDVQASSSARAARRGRAQQRAGGTPLGRAARERVPALPAPGGGEGRQGGGVVPGAAWAPADRCMHRSGPRHMRRGVQRSAAGQRYVVAQARRPRARVSAEGLRRGSPRRLALRSRRSRRLRPPRAEADASSSST